MFASALIKEGGKYRKSSESIALIEKLVIPIGRLSEKDTFQDRIVIHQYVKRRAHMKIRRGPVSVAIVTRFDNGTFFWECFNSKSADVDQSTQTFRKSEKSV
jgi:hypothetical protein